MDRDFILFGKERLKWPIFEELLNWDQKSESAGTWRQ